ncbi:UNVERIFIED_CONTAM: hypothetical protein K2H54_036343 [Gekko kuhli]
MFLLKLEGLFWCVCARSRSSCGYLQAARRLHLEDISQSNVQKTVIIKNTQLKSSEWMDFMTSKCLTWSPIIPVGETVMSDQQTSGKENSLTGIWLMTQKNSFKI